MKKLLFTLIVTVTTGCAASTGFGLGSIPVGGHGAGIGVLDIDARATGEDEHWFTTEDYLVSERPYTNRKLANLRVAKMTAIATNQTNTEARFLIANGDELWSATYFRTRVARESDLAIGVLAFCNGGAYDHYIDAPRKKRDARQGKWILASITDTSDLYKGRVTVGDASCDVRGVRVLFGM